ncbi:hypothetical protein GCM10010869_09500 [Mesorhizobium tianshanense]|uniref:Uncharacterized protein n=1 Tax=Mesorhizobium tianshanense TaxID=39844 RepID=A0A562NLK5_9HYPH|nr:hypothetical protein [Mesorhizobium tianshanense]TWI33048.1 hypothetical protein IQ26_04257 [Mesorhizobium tianshanense]GLS35362.1 hypothetical protein GCM10010869_09500 [Mesorhizobium tianshanense]
MADTNLISRTVIPAAPGTFLLSFQYGEEPIRTPVVAWLVVLTSYGTKQPDEVMHGAEPITVHLGDSGRDGTQTILFPTGQVIEPMCRSYDTEADWLQDARERADKENAGLGDEGRRSGEGMST